jgi:hypothetical protein
MSITSGRTTVGITPVQVDGNSVNPFVLYIHNESNTKKLYLGNGTVSVENGFSIDPSSVQNFTLFPNQSLFMLSDSGDHIVSWLRIPV